MQALLSRNSLKIMLAIAARSSNLKLVASSIKILVAALLLS